MTRKTFVGGIVTGIVGIVFSMLLPAAAYGCSIPGLVLSVKKSREEDSSAGFVLNIIALALALINSVTAVCITARGFFKKHSGQF